MPPPSDSLSSTSLPLGADTHTHTTWYQSGSVPHSVRHGYEPSIHHHGSQTYSAVVADALASDAVSRLANTHIPPSSINDIPRSHKKVLRKHPVLFWIVITIFHISLTALTAAIVLGAVKAHENGQNGVKCAAIIVGVFGFSGMLGSAAVIWLIMTGRKERARLEKRWADDERAKEASCLRERRSEQRLRQVIRSRERSLSRGRSRVQDHDRNSRPAVSKIPSFRAMTPASTSPMRTPDHNTQPMSKRRRSPWPRPMDISDDGDLDNATDLEKNLETLQGIQQRISQGTSREIHYKIKRETSKENIQKKNHGNDDEGLNRRDKDKNDGSHGQQGMAPARRNLRVSASTIFGDSDPSDTNSGENYKGEIVIPTQTARSKVSLPFHNPNPLPTPPESGHTSPTPLDTASTYISPSSTDTHSSGLYNYLRYPLAPKTPPLHPAPAHSNNLAPSDSNTQDDAIMTPLPLQHRIYGWGDGGLGSEQSDDNFRAMLDVADDAGSEDERDRQIRKQKSRERVEQWASSFDEDGGGEDREEKGKRLREAVERGLRRVATRKKVRREANIGVEGRRKGVRDGYGG